MWNTTMGATAAEYAYKDRGWKTVYVVTDDFLSYTTSLSEYFIEHFKNLGGTVIAEDHYTQGDGDFSGQLQRIQSLEPKPDFLYFSSYMPDLAMMVQMVRDAGINLPIMGGDSYDDPGFFSALGSKYGSDIIFVTHSWMGPEATQDMGRFLQLYETKYGEPPDTAFVATGWDAVMILAQAMEEARTTEGAEVAKAMEDLQFILLTGKLDWSSAETGHEPDIEAALVQLRNGEPSFIGWGKPDPNSSLPFALEHADVPLFRPPTADANTTIAMAGIYFIMSTWWAIKYNGPFGLVKHIFGVKGGITGWMVIPLFLVFVFIGLIEGRGDLAVRQRRNPITPAGRPYAGHPGDARACADLHVSRASRRY